MFPTVLTSAFTAAKGGEGNASHWKKTDRNKNDDGNNNSNLSFRRALMSAFNHTSLVSLFFIPSIFAEFRMRLLKYVYGYESC